jgi:hypothetical protein
MSEIEAGEGYRLIDKAKDKKKPGDEYWSCFDKWVTASNDGMFHSEHVYRRRVPAKPEAMEIDHQTIKCNSFDEVMAKDDSGEVWRVVSNAQQARQLADWLTRYAEWREAQESVAKTPPN